MNKKFYGIQLVIILTVAIILQAFLSVVYTLDFEKGAYKQYEDYCLNSVQNSSYILQRDIDSVFAKAKEVSYSKIDYSTSLQNFDMLIQIDENSNITYISSEQRTSAPIILENIENGKYVVKTAEKLIKDESNSLFMIVRINSGTNSIYYCKNLQNDISSLLSTGFDGIILTRYDTVALYSSDSNYNDTIISNTLPYNTTVQTEPVSELKINGKQCTIAYYNLGENFDNMYLVGYLTSEKVNGYVKNSSYKFVCIVVALLAISLASLLLAIFEFIKEYKNITIFTGIYPKLFVAFYDTKGKLKFENKAIKQSFGNVDVLENKCFDGDIKTYLTNRESFTVKLTDKNGLDKYLSFVIKNGFAGTKLIGGDCTKLMNQYYNYKFLSETDEFTGLKNKKELEKDFALIKTGGFVKIKIISTDNFKNLFGYEFYRLLLQSLTKKLKESFASIGRLYFFGQDEFVLLANGEEKYKLLLEKINEIMTNINSPINVADNIVQIDCRAGILNFTEHIDFSKANECAEVAIQASRQMERTKFAVYKETESNFINYASSSLIKDMEQKNELEIYFQPQQSLSTNKIVGFEALTRILNKSINIEQFIKNIEHYGFMMQLGDFIYDKAFEFAKSVEKFGVTISVNVSGVQFLQDGFTDYFIKKINEHNVNPKFINIEVTESFLIGDIEKTIKKLNILKDFGIGIHLDDFGIAYSSVLYLKNLPVDVVKFDREFVKDLQENRDSRIILTSLVNMCKQINKQTIAEGVELSKQKQFLQSIGCDEIQGFIISHAVCGDKAIELVKKINKVDDNGDSINPFRKGKIAVERQNLPKIEEKIEKNAQNLTETSENENSQDVFPIQNIQDEQSNISQTNGKKGEN